jgi:hypothetical protein
VKKIATAMVLAMKMSKAVSPGATAMKVLQTMEMIYAVLVWILSLLILIAHLDSGSLNNQVITAKI